MGTPATQTDYMAEDGDRRESFGQMVRSNDLLRVERRNRILKLRRQGFTYDQMSEALAEGADGGEPFEITASGCQSAVTRYVDELRREDAESVEVVKHIENERLERMFKRLELDASKDDPAVRSRAIRSQLKVMERRAKLLGLDEPAQLDVSGTVNHQLVADPDHVRQVDSSFSERHGGAVLELPVGDGAREK